MCGITYAELIRGSVRADRTFIWRWCRFNLMKVPKATTWAKTLTGILMFQTKRTCFCAGLSLKTCNILSSVVLTQEVYIKTNMTTGEQIWGVSCSNKIYVCLFLFLKCHILWRMKNFKQTNYVETWDTKLYIEQMVVIKQDATPFQNHPNWEGCHKHSAHP